MKDIITIILLGIIVILIAISTIKEIIEFIKSKNKNNTNNNANKVDVEVLKILLTENSAEKIDNTLDQFINAAGDNYTLLKLSQNSLHYISEEIKDEMIMYIVGTVKKNMTTEMRTLIGLIHVINSEKDLDDLITLRTKLYVLNYMVNYNRPLDSETQLL